MKVGIMQPYFLPYIGYFQLIRSVDLFLVYDNIQYTKKGWMNRNRMFLNGKDVMFSLPLKKDSDYLDVCQRELAADFNRQKMLNKIKAAYQRAPYFSETFPLIELIVKYENPNLFCFLQNSIVRICEHLEITTEIRISSDIVIDHGLKSQNKVIALCEAVGASAYVNAIGGMELYSKHEFDARGVNLKFIRSKPFKYDQFGYDFIPWLSILDVMMFNSLDVIKERLISSCEIIDEGE
ncbi:WbqC family protein [Mariprofundus aestuarium]|uniref:WbqC family protein n=1 Tax=Mariprofundus aestuarium TaxID=1921086 RepID=UPI000C228BFA|nr:WbqC family protein [Mariprofundus aestuarium]